MLIAYDAAGNVVATLAYMVAKDANGDVIGLVDFYTHEAAGGKLRDIWDVQDATGSATWPEWIGSAAHDFTVELDPDKRIAALVHKRSGHRRERMALEAAVAAQKAQKDDARDMSHIVGRPDAALILNVKGQTAKKVKQGTPDHLPILRA